VSGVIFMIFLGADMLNGALALTQMPARAGGVHQHAAAAATGDPGPGAAGLHRARQLMESCRMLLLTLRSSFPP